MEASDLLMIVLAILLPPVAVIILKGCGGDFCINLILTILGWVPGAIHAVWLVLKSSE